MSLLLQHRTVGLGVIVMVEEGHSVSIVVVQEALVPIKSNSSLWIAEVEAPVGVVALQRRGALRREDFVGRRVKVVGIAEGSSVQWVGAIAIGIGREGGAVIVRAKGVELPGMLCW